MSDAARAKATEWLRARCNVPAGKKESARDSLERTLDAYAVELTEALREENARLQGALAWAMGEDGEFPPRESGQGAYWWRTELRRRALVADHEAQRSGEETS